MCCFHFLQSVGGVTSSEAVIKGLRKSTVQAWKYSSKYKKKCEQKIIEKQFGRGNHHILLIK